MERGLKPYLCELRGFVVVEPSMRAARMLDRLEAQRLTLLGECVQARGIQ